MLLTHSVEEVPGLIGPHSHFLLTLGPPVEGPDPGLVSCVLCPVSRSFSPDDDSLGGESAVGLLRPRPHFLLTHGPPVEGSDLGQVSCVLCQISMSFSSRSFLSRWAWSRSQGSWSGLLRTSALISLPLRQVSADHEFLRHLFLSNRPQRHKMRCRRHRQNILCGKPQRQFCRPSHE